MRLLIAEDELDLAEALTVFFEKNHFTVDAVHNGFDAYEYAAAGGYDKHDRDKAPTDGGPGGKGGGAVNLTVWHGGNNLVLSTACKLELTSGSAGGSFPCGDGEGYTGYGGRQAMEPSIIYDLMDCDIQVKEYTYTGSEIKPTLADVTVTYSASSNRDGAMVYSASGTVNVQQNATLAMTPSLMVTAMAAGNKTFSDPPVAGNGTIPGSQDITVQGKYVNNANDVYSVNIAWSAMEFTYTIPSTAEWDPEKHVYTAGSDGDNGTWSCDTTERCPPPKTPPWPMRPRSTSPSCPRVSCPTTTPPCRICLRSP